MDTLTRMKAFTQVVEDGGFSAAARTLGRSKALVSKYVKELEDELGVRLLNRTTRQLSVTEAGQNYYENATGILRQIDALSEAVRVDHQAPKGRLRVTAPRAFSGGSLAQAMMSFAAAYPEISLDLHLEDRFADLVEEGFDAAIRISELPDSSLIARKISSFRIVTCASPALLNRAGTPLSPQDLFEIPCVIDTNFRSQNTWPFDVENERTFVRVHGRVHVNSPTASRHAALAGLGVARVPWFTVSQDIEAGNLKTLLVENELKSLGVYAVYPHRRHLSGKVRAFVDHLADWFQKKTNDLAGTGAASAIRS